MASQGMIALIGSGELSDSMAEVHRLLMARLNEPARPVFIDSAAGFELNIESIDQKALSYFKRNFNLPLRLARYRSRNATADVIASALAAIQDANYIFAGPGSPSYALRTWQGSPVWDAILKRWREGAMLVFASAAVSTLGVQTLPVYEIYKVGDDPFWLPGMNVLSDIGLNAAVIPHWNNKSGDLHDTRYCFMGAERFDALRTQLDPNVTVIGVDEYTALLLDVSKRQGEVLGIGEVTIRLQNSQSTYAKGDQFDFDHPDLTATVESGESITPESTVASEAEAIQEASLPDSDIVRLKSMTETALNANDLPAIREGLLSLSLIAGMGLEQGVTDRASAAVQALQVLLPSMNVTPVATAPLADWEAERAILLDLIVTARNALRTAKQWAVSDTLRDGLAALHYTIADTAQGSVVTKGQ